MLKSELPDAIINTLVETMKQRDAELAALRVKLAAVKADRDRLQEERRKLRNESDHLSDKVFELIDRDNQRAAAARRVAAYCRELRWRKVELELRALADALEKRQRGGDA